MLYKVNFYPQNKQSQLKLQQNKIIQMGEMYIKYTSCLSNSKNRPKLALTGVKN